MARRRRPRRAGALTELPPLRLLGQIVVLQAVFYAAATLLMLFSALVSGRPVSAELVLGWAPVRGDTAQGFLVAFMWVLVGGVCGGSAIVALVGRSKLVLDFALTLHAIHLAIVVLYSGALPAHLAWWLTMAASSAACVLLATWGCRYRELRPISFGGAATAAAAAATAAASPAAAPLDSADGPGAPGDEEQGFTRGRGRGRGRDGAGDYEMVSLPADEGGRKD